MSRRDQPESDPLAKLAKIALGLGFFAVAAAKAFDGARGNARRDSRRGSSSLKDIMRQSRRRPGNRRKPPEAGIAVPAVPPNGPLPKNGGAEAPLEFD